MIKILVSLAYENKLFVAKTYYLVVNNVTILFVSSNLKRLAEFMFFLHNYNVTFINLSRKNPFYAFQLCVTLVSF